jgi:D-alanyl-D-alanine carboxypeptidase
MNDKATSLGMTQTKIVDVDGRNPSNTSTSEDLFALAKYLYNNRSFVLKISSGRITSSVYGEPVFKNLQSLNTPKGTESAFVGGMVDTSGESQTFLGIFEVEIQGEKRPIAIIALGSKDGLADAQKMYNYVRLMYQ